MSGILSGWVRVPLMALALCGAVFVFGFAIGRAERPKPPVGEVLYSRLSAASAGASIPLALAGAPTIGVRDVRAIGRPASPRRSGGARGTALAGAVDSTGSPSTLTTTATTLTTSTPEAATTSTRAATQPTGHAPDAKRKPGGSTSFDSSD